MRKTALLFFGTLVLNLHAHAATIENLGSAITNKLTASRINDAITNNLKVINYTGKDISFSEIGSLHVSIWSPNPIIC